MQMQLPVSPTFILILSLLVSAAYCWWLILERKRIILQLDQERSKTQHLLNLVNQYLASPEEQRQPQKQPVSNTEPDTYSRVSQPDVAQRHVGRRLDIAPSNIQITSMDEMLIKKAVDLVEQNIANPEFSVEDLGHSLAMSRVYLYKKLLALTGKTPIEFIRVIRLKRAAQLLERSQLTVAEVAYKVGFNNPKYFARYFKEEFDLLPKAYQKKSKNLIQEGGYIVHEGQFAHFYSVNK